VASFQILIVGEILSFEAVNLTLKIKLMYVFAGMVLSLHSILISSLVVNPYVTWKFGLFDVI